MQGLHFPGSELSQKKAMDNGLFIPVFGVWHRPLISFLKVICPEGVPFPNFKVFFT
jgi:hypothetical protein